MAQPLVATTGASVPGRDGAYQALGSQPLWRSGRRSPRPRSTVEVTGNSDEMGDHAYDREAYRERPVINRLKPYRRSATRYDKTAASYLAMLTIAMILEWI